MTCRQRFSPNSHKISQWKPNDCLEMPSNFKNYRGFLVDKFSKRLLCYYEIARLEMFYSC